ARIAPAGLLPDPTLMAGVQNASLGRSTASGGHGSTSGGEPMTMNMIGIEQTLPFPGKLALQRREASSVADAAEAALAATTRQIARDVKDAYYELAFLDRAIEIVARNQRVLTDFTNIAEARYAVGSSAQQDVLKARVETSRLAANAEGLTEQRRASLARLNALLDRPSEQSIAAPVI